MSKNKSDITQQSRIVSTFFHASRIHFWRQSIIFNCSIPITRSMKKERHFVEN
nr:MAG TPA: hypothetical protein [Caudoviricetes sp.]